MAKLTKQQAKLHAEAVALATKDRLTHDEQLFILDNWQESAQHINTVAGAFFTPYELACGLAIEVAPGRVIDLCAGIGSLSRAVLDYHALNEPREIVCVELNPAYVEVGKKVVPEATWICGDVLDVPAMGLGRFDTACSNPPFGRIQRNKDKSAPRYKGSDFEFIVIDVAAHIADFAAFIVPQMSAGFTYSGRQSYKRQTSGKAVEFQAKTGLRFEAGCGVDTAQFKDQWRGVSPICEIVCVDFTEASASAAPAPKPASVPVPPKVFATSELGQFDMFGEAA